MNVWVVEDSHKDAAIAAALACEVATKENTTIQVYWNQTIIWESPLALPPPERGEASTSKEDRPAGIIILDLFDASGEFRAGRFLRQLRQWEVTHNILPAWVILWSVYTGLDEAQEFIAAST